MLTGFVTQYSKEKGFGFLDCPELDLTGIYFHISTCHSEHTNWQENDVVEFELVRSLEQSFAYEAADVHFIRNQQFDQLKALHESGVKLSGYLKVEGKEFFIKDKVTKVRIHLTVSEEEINFRKYCSLQLDKLVGYEIREFKKGNKIKAVLAKREFSADHKRALSGATLQGYVLEKVGNGYSVKVLNSVKGFVPFVYTCGKDLKHLDPVELIGVGTKGPAESILFKFADYIEPALPVSVGAEAKTPVHRTLYEEIGHTFHILVNRAVGLMF